MTNDEMIAKIIEKAATEIADAIREASSPDYNVTIQFDSNDLIAKEIGYGLHHIGDGAFAIANALDGLKQSIDHIGIECDEISGEIRDLVFNISNPEEPDTVTDSIRFLANKVEEKE